MHSLIRVSRTTARGLARLLALALLASLLVCGANAESTVGLLRHMDVNGVDYIAKTDITTILLLGIDERLHPRDSGVYREGGQSDFLMLVVIDHANKQIRRLQIDRDCMTEIRTVGVLGNYSGTRLMQICLAHGMGDGYEMSCKLAVEAVSKLLLDTEIDLYAAVPVSCVGTINETLGGVTVILPDDYTAYDPTMVKGAEMTLNNQQAEYMVRGRLLVGDGLNASRMERQQVFINAATNQLRAKLKENANFADTLLDAVEEVMVSNFTRGRIINEVNRAYQYDILPVETLTGEYTIGADGYQQFHADPDGLFAWVVDALYTPNN